MQGSPVLDETHRPSADGRLTSNDTSTDAFDAVTSPTSVLLEPEAIPSEPKPLTVFGPPRSKPSVRGRALIFLINFAVFVTVNHFLNHDSRYAEPKWSSLKHQGNAALMRKDYTTAEHLYREALAEADRLGPRDWKSGMCMNNLGLALGGQKRFKEAEPVIEQSLAILRKSPSPEEGGLYLTLSNLGRTYLMNHKPAKALPLYQEAIPLEDTYPMMRSGLRWADMDDLACALRDTGHAKEASETFKQALSLAPGNEERQNTVRDMNAPPGTL